jgi:hypothetical protein
MKTALILISAMHHRVEERCTSIFDVVFQLPYVKYWSGLWNSLAPACPSMERRYSRFCERHTVQFARLWVLQTALPVEVGFYMIPTRMAKLVLQMSADQVAFGPLVLDPSAVFPRAESALSV